MPIPSDFNPLGAFSELPYIQPVMTSYNTWSNHPSFGLIFSKARYYAQDYPWEAMANPLSETSYWRVHTSILSDLEIKTVGGTPLKILSIAVNGGVASDGTARLAKMEMDALNENGVYENIITIEKPASSINFVKGFAKREFYSNSFLLRAVPPFPYNYTVIRNLQLNAIYMT